MGGINMASRNIDQGIRAIQAGNLSEGARMLRFVLREEQLEPQLQAVVYMWLAETSPDVDFKLDCYRKANQADPNNAEVSQRLSFWLQQKLPGAAPNPSDTGNIPTQGNQMTDDSFWIQGTQPGTQGQPAINPGQPPQPNQNQGWAQNQPNNNGYSYPNISQNPLASNYGGNVPMAPPSAQNLAPSQQADQPLRLNEAPFSVGIVGGPNGNGSGIFVTRDGLVATTRHVVGGQEHLNVHLSDGRQIQGQVVRSFPALDLALLQTNVQIGQLLPVTQYQQIPDQLPIFTVTHPGQQGQITHSSKRSTRHQTATHWFPTMIDRLLDAGGNPVYDQNSTLIGLLTKNTRRSNGFAYALHILKVYELVQQYYNEKQNVGQTLYCFSCGVMSRAVAFNGFYCENCGSTLSYAVEITRFPQMNLLGLYGENAHHPCPNCGSQVGYYKGLCMRCGYEE
jgi:predicted RNA-binding Zn-ribbon protein involved in translation (DUF1610 family)